MRSTMSPTGASWFMAYETEFTRQTPEAAGAILGHGGPVFFLFAYQPSQLLALYGPDARSAPYTPWWYKSPLQPVIPATWL